MCEIWKHKRNFDISHFSTKLNPLFPGRRANLPGTKLEPLLRQKLPRRCTGSVTCCSGRHISREETFQDPIQFNGPNVQTASNRNNFQGQATTAAGELSGSCPTGKARYGGRQEQRLIYSSGYSQNTWTKGNWLNQFSVQRGMFRCSCEVRTAALLDDWNAWNNAEVMEFCCIGLHCIALHLHLQWWNEWKEKIDEERMERSGAVINSWWNTARGTNRLIDRTNLDREFKLTKQLLFRESVFLIHETEDQTFPNNVNPTTGLQVRTSSIKNNWRRRHTNKQAVARNKSTQ